VIPCVLVCFAAVAGLGAATSVAGAKEPERARKVPRKPVICAHRGASAAAPENTVAAFRLAGELGADMFELDVSLTKDGGLVIMHDALVDRTTDGTGAVADLTLAEIRRLDAGSWKSPRFKGERVPTLDEVFTNRDGQMVNVEIKANVPNVRQTAEKVATLIRKHGVQNNVVVSSFSASALARMHEIAPDIPTGFLFGGTIPDAFPPGITAVHPLHTVVDRRFVDWAHGNGWKVNPWTIDDPTEMRRLMDLGVDMIITNVPDTLKRLRDADVLAA
jgi:glycerophosphoryl diester phosphodiesterase